jgi:hypothetical protein
MVSRRAVARRAAAVRKSENAALRRRIGSQNLETAGPPEAQRANWLPALKSSDFRSTAGLLVKDCDHRRLMDAARGDEGELKLMRFAERHAVATERYSHGAEVTFKGSSSPPAR